MRRRWIIACLVLCWLALAVLFVYFHWRMDRLERDIRSIPAVPEIK